ncbi:RNA recognition motif domain-containing protein [Desulfonatronum lacustre]|uniref:RNA recognition motif domain-containing protein n=1 Tax=Desulfonatronum lacustre TaxID=66849 RepID=UPI00048D0115|nr:RNA-binding protein [Desulfonatronum lacustre]SMP39181.1 RNA recognition motif. (a.k.a. RRM, RBD, or RNP domain) [Desulfonatronum zhilinae]
MDNKLYVGNLSYSTTEDDLHALFSDAGSVQSVAVIKDRDSGRSKGFGFVEMSSDEDAQKAIDLFHGTDYQGRPLTVNVARPREDRPRFDGGGGGKGRRSGGGGGRQRDW